MPSLTEQQGTRELYLDLMKKALTASIYDESAWAILPYARPGPGSARHPVRFARALFKHLLARSIVNQSTIIIKKWPFDETSRGAGRDFPLFGYTMVGLRRLDNLQHCLEDVLASGIPGDLIETGAWRGGATIFMRALLRAHGVTDRKVWVADSFEGLPSPADKHDDWDLSGNEYFKVSLEQVRANFSKFGLLDGQVEFLPGWFRDTLPAAPIGKLAILRLDGDMYDSTMDALTHLYVKVSPGGYVIVDDYHSWASCRRAVTEFLAMHALKPDIKAIDQDAVYWRKE
jgi:O-methyltransferase